MMMISPDIFALLIFFRAGAAKSLPRRLKDVSLRILTSVVHNGP